MKTAFVKNSEGKRFHLNADADAWGTGTVRKIKGIEGVTFAICNLDFGTDVYAEIYDSENNTIEKFWGIRLKDITKETEDGNKMINFMKTYSKGLEILSTYKVGA